jgi:hypothetical protein
MKVQGGNTYSFITISLAPDRLAVCEAWDNPEQKSGFFLVTIFFHIVLTIHSVRQSKWDLLKKAIMQSTFGFFFEKKNILW